MFKFGEKVENLKAGPDNPYRRAYFVRSFTRRGRLNPGHIAELTDGTGYFWETEVGNLRRPTPPSEEA